MRIGEAAHRLGISTETIRKWEREGLIKAARTPLGQRVFTPQAILEIQQIIKERGQYSDRGKTDDSLR